MGTPIDQDPSHYILSDRAVSTESVPETMDGARGLCARLNPSVRWPEPVLALLAGLLAVAPRERLSAAAALELPFFDPAQFDAKAWDDAAFPGCVSLTEGGKGAPLPGGPMPLGSAEDGFVVAGCAEWSDDE